MSHLFEVKEGKMKQGKVLEILLARYQKSREELELEIHIFGMITGRNMRGMSFSRWMVTAPFVSRLSIFDSTRTSS